LQKAPWSDLPASLLATSDGAFEASRSAAGRLHTTGEPTCLLLLLYKQSCGTQARLCRQAAKHAGQSACIFKTRLACVRHKGLGRFSLAVSCPLEREQAFRAKSIEDQANCLAQASSLNPLHLFPYTGGVTTQPLTPPTLTSSACI